MGGGVNIEVGIFFCFVTVFLPSFQIETHKKQFGPFCGKTLPAKIETQTSVVNITFITDMSGAHTGWKVKYTAAGG